jgi:RNA polymerase sigma-70 factor (ECF subfamily)
MFGSSKRGRNHGGADPARGWASPEDIFGRPSTKRAGPPAVALARRMVATRTDLTIDPLETTFRLDPDGVAVRVWMHIPNSRISPDVQASLDRFARAFGSPGRLSRVFFLAVSYGLGQRQIAALLGISRWRTRLLLLRAIASLDLHAQDEPDPIDTAACPDRHGDLP